MFENEEDQMLFMQ